jgi:ABC-2 type transport system ATP-binding protein
MQSVVEIKNISKQYKNAAKPAVNELTFSIPSQSIFGLLGPNGAGKTTIISMMCGLFKQNSGEIFIDGKDLSKNLNEVKQIIGVVPQEIALYDKLTAYENLFFLGQMYGIETSELKNRVKKNLEILGLEQNSHQQIKTFSGGMKRRINLIAGILHEPKLLILDEPTVGVDVQSRTAIINHLRQINKEKGTAILYTSHHLDEAESFCSDIAIIDEGKLITSGKTKELTEDNNCKSVEEVYLKITGHKFRDY